MRLFPRLLALVLCGASLPARAQPIHGITECVGNAQLVELVQADMGALAPDGQRRIHIKEVLKGIDAKRESTLPAESLQPGQAAVLVFPYRPPEPFDLNHHSPEYALPPIRVWRLDADGKVDTDGIAESGGSTWAPPPVRHVELDAVRQAVATTSPEQVGLNDRVQAALGDPKFILDGGQALFTRLVVILLDLRRSPATAPDPNHYWPAVPADLRIPPDDFPAPLLSALEKNDLDAFAPAFVVWLDSGAARDRAIQAAIHLDRGLIEGSSLAYATGGWGGHWLPAPRLRPDVLLNPTIPAKVRMQVIALLARLIHFDRFDRERQQLIQSLAAHSPDNLDTLRRAAFWEPHGTETHAVGDLAITRLKQHDQDPETQQFFWNYGFLQDQFLGVITEQIKAGRQPYTDEVLAYVRDYHDTKARAFAHDLWERKDDRMVPILADWIKDRDATLRVRAGHILAITPDRRLTPNILTALGAETDTEAKASLLIALAQTGDERGREWLTNALPDYSDRLVRPEIVRGLGRIRDERSLPVLADLVAHVDEKDDAYAEAMYAFLYITHDRDIWPPAAYQSSYGIERARVARGSARIKAWREAQPTPAAAPSVTPAY